jgi:Holliday junction DNA helicase RuvA
MIATVSGLVADLRLDSAVVEVGGVGILTYCTPTTLAELRVGTPVCLHTTMIVREDSLTLYGFSSSDERRTFEILMTASGVGPRLALAMLAVYSPDQLRHAISTSDHPALTAVPGIGKKGAEKIVVELRDRLGPSLEGSAGKVSASSDDQVVDALIGLGWNTKDARAAVESARRSTAVDVEIPELLRSALQELKRT